MRGVIFNIYFLIFTFQVVSCQDSNVLNINLENTVYQLKVNSKNTKKVITITHDVKNNGVLILNVDNRFELIKRGGFTVAGESEYIFIPVTSKKDIYVIKSVLGTQSMVYEDSFREFLGSYIVQKRLKEANRIR